MEYRLILASGSPRRKELLKEIFDDFEVIVSDADENIEKKSPEILVVELAKIKALSVYEDIKESLTGPYVIIGSDTVVELDGKILGKPKNKEEARLMIESISGRSHFVHTGVCLIMEDGPHSFHETSKVNVVKLSDKEIEAYISSNEPYDKAGAYGIQGIFGKYVAGIEGNYDNIVGLPVARLYQELKNLGVIND